MQRRSGQLAYGRILRDTRLQNTLRGAHAGRLQVEGDIEVACQGQKGELKASQDRKWTEFPDSTISHYLECLHVHFTTVRASATHSKGQDHSRGITAGRAEHERGVVQSNECLSTASPQQAIQRAHPRACGRSWRQASCAALSAEVPVRRLAPAEGQAASRQPALYAGSPKQYGAYLCSGRKSVEVPTFM